MPYYFKDEDRHITLAEIKRRVYPSPVPKNPAKNAFDSRGFYWYENADQPQTLENEKCVLSNTFSLVNDKYERQWAIVNKYNAAEDAQQAKVQEINEWYKREMDNISAGLTQHEINTFYRQDLEATELSNNSAATTPFITKQAVERGVTVATLKDKIIAKATLFNDLSAKALGRKQFLEDTVESATTIEEVINIEVGYAD